MQTEVDLLSKIQHPNIITLLGYCVHDETKLLVYELMHNGSLETQLHGEQFFDIFNLNPICLKVYVFNILQPLSLGQISKISVRVL